MRFLLTMVLKSNRKEVPFTMRLKVIGPQHQLKAIPWWHEHKI